MGPFSLNQARVDLFQRVLANAKELATPEAFEANPSLVWEFYHYRRWSSEEVKVIQTKGEQMRCQQGQAKCSTLRSYSITAAFKQEGKEFTLLTQNIDKLHMRAGTKDVVELHGSLRKTRCTECKDVQVNHEMSICAALDGRYGAPDRATPDARIPFDGTATMQRLYRTITSTCGVVWREIVQWDIGSSR